MRARHHTREGSETHEAGGLQRTSVERQDVQAESFMTDKKGNQMNNDQHVTETFGTLRKKILVLGHGGHGKDSFAEMLHIASQKKLGYTSSSRAMLDEIYPALVAAKGYTDKEVAFEDRRNNRQLWKELINLYNSTDKTALTRAVLSQTDIYVGMRDDKEFQASKEMFTHIFWVDAAQRVSDKDPTMLIEFDINSMLFVDNNRTRADLAEEVFEILAARIL